MKCAICMHWYPIPMRGGGFSEGECRRYPPTSGPGPYGSTYASVIVPANYLCGEWKDATPVPAVYSPPTGTAAGKR